MNKREKVRERDREKERQKLRYLALFIFCLQHLVHLFLSSIFLIDEFKREWISERMRELVMKNVVTLYWSWHIDFIILTHRQLTIITERPLCKSRARLWFLSSPLGGARIRLCKTGISYSTRWRPSTVIQQSLDREYMAKIFNGWLSECAFLQLAS